MEPEGSDRNVSAPENGVEAELDDRFGSYLAERGFDLVEVTYRTEHRGKVLRFTVDRVGGGLTVDEGVKLTREIGALIEADSRLDSLLPGPYNLEVSSPGIFRTLSRPRDFERAWGKRIKLRWRPGDGAAEEVIGVLKAYGDGKVVLEADGETIEVDTSSVIKARLEPELPFGRK